jgi:dCMP deaminase
MRNVPSWDEYFMQLARHAASRSKDPDRQVGCVLVFGRQVIATGYNGFPIGVKEDFMRWEKDKKSDYVIHAEENALLQAARQGIITAGSTAYVTRAPCHECMKKIINAGIEIVVSPAPEKNSKWSGSWAFAAVMAKEADVSWRFVDFAPSA